MGCEWISLAQCAGHIVDNRGRTCPVGKTGIPLIATNCLRSETLYPTYETERFVSAETYASWFRGHPVAGDIIFVTKGSPGRVCLTPDPVDFCIAQDMVAIRANERLVYQRYLFAVLRSATTRRAIDDLQVGTMIPHFKKGDFDKLMLPIPSRPLQEAIGDLHFELCERIDLLRQTNTTLEAIAQTLFKSWFVDFDPVHAKAEGRKPEAMDAATAALFPSEFEDSELGPIPKGWDVETLGGVANVIDCLHAKKPELLDNGRPYLQLNCIRSDGLLDVRLAAAISDGDYEKWTSRIEATTGDCVITNVGRVGAVAQIPRNYLAAIGRNMTAVRCKSTFPHPTVLIELLTSEFMRHEIEQKTDAGTILAALNVKNIPKLRFVRGADEILQKFETLCRPLRVAMEENLQRANLLASIRDALLPRLISGKLRLPDDAEAIEAALA